MRLIFTLCFVYAYKYDAFHIQTISRISVEKPSFRVFLVPVRCVYGIDPSTKRISNPCEILRMVIHKSFDL